MKTKAAKCLLVGLLADVALALAALLYLTWAALADYDGQCGLGIIFGSGRQPCTRVEAVLFNVELGAFIALVEWPLTLLVLAAPPALGLLAGLLLAWRAGRRAR
jgi:hypothetical protein